MRISYSCFKFNSIFIRFVRLPPRVRPRNRHRLEVVREVRAIVTPARPVARVTTLEASGRLGVGRIVQMMRKIAWLLPRRPCRLITLVGKRKTTRTNGKRSRKRRRNAIGIESEVVGAGQGIASERGVGRGSGSVAAIAGGIVIGPVGTVNGIGGNVVEVGRAIEKDAVSLDNDCKFCHRF